MNPISQYLADQLIAVLFLYGLAFFTMGVALLLASRQASELRIVRAILPLGLFGLLHAVHEWFEMFQLIRLEQTGVAPSTGEEAARLVLLVASFAMLLHFAGRLIASERQSATARLAITGAPIMVWTIAAVWLALASGWPAGDIVAGTDVLARYLVGLPAAVLAAWALMGQQHTFRRMGMPQFGADLVWAAAMFVLYGVVGQVFVRASPVPPSQLINGALFMQWFGIPVQLFRGILAALLTYFMLRAVRAFELVARHRLDAATEAKTEAQARAAALQREGLRESTRLNQELQVRAAELALLLDLSNLLAGHTAWTARVEYALAQIVASLQFTDAGLILLAREDGSTQLAAATGYATLDAEAPGARYGPSWQLGMECLTSGRAICLHADKVIIEFDVDAAIVGQECWQHPSPTRAIALPLRVDRAALGALVLSRAKGREERLQLTDLQVLSGVAQQLSMSIENARLYREAQEHEKVLAELLYRVVDAQESERQRIARDLHDATGQSLSAIALGLRGLANAVPEGDGDLSQHLTALQGFATDALVDLRRLIADLRPPQLDDLGLVPAIRAATQVFQRRNPAIETALTIEGDVPRLRPEYDTLIYRIVQEALTNVVKHAQADRVEIQIAVDGEELTVEVIDNGKGFDAERMSGVGAAGWGLLGIRERTQLLGGEARFRSAPGAGTRISVRIPLGDARQSPAQEPIQESRNVQRA